MKYEELQMYILARRRRQRECPQFGSLHYASAFQISGRKQRRTSIIERRVKGLLKDGYQKAWAANTKLSSATMCRMWTQLRNAVGGLDEGCEVAAEDEGPKGSIFNQFIDMHFQKTSNSSWDRWRQQGC